MMKIPAFILHYFLLVILPVENANPFVRIGLVLRTAARMESKPQLLLQKQKCQHLLII
jgi:hypothetical protein